MKPEEIIDMISRTRARSKWDKAVREDAEWLMETIIEHEGKEYDFCGSPAYRKKLLNGAGDWKQFSYGGCALCYDSDLAEHYMTPSELKRWQAGKLGGIDLLEVQGRALHQAERLILSITG